MLAVIFELLPRTGKGQDYFDLAAELKPLLKDIDGFISIERFESLTEQGKYLSLSFWRDEEAIKQWRNLEAHRMAQGQGRNTIFEHYRLRVAEVKRDYDHAPNVQRPKDSAEKLL